MWSLILDTREQESFKIFTSKISQWTDPFGGASISVLSKWSSLMVMAQAACFILLAREFAKLNQELLSATLRFKTYAFTIVSSTLIQLDAMLLILAEISTFITCKLIIGGSGRNKLAIYASMLLERGEIMFQKSTA